MRKERAFTLIELIVVIAIIAVLSGVILFSITQYINKGKDSNVSGNLVALIPAGEVFYNIGNSYSGFCASGVVTTAFSTSQIPSGANPRCAVAPSGQSWLACAQEFTTSSNIYCVDSRGMKEDVSSGNCTTLTTNCSTNGTCQCP